MAVLGWIEWVGQFGQRYPGHILVGFASIILLGVLLRLLIGRSQRTQPTTHGSAHWGTKQDARKAGFLRRRGVILGIGWGHYLRDESEANIVLVGSTRSGKGLLLNSSLLELGQDYSVQVTDPKAGENYKISHRWRQRFGPVWVFAPFSPELQRSGHWIRADVLDSIRLGEPEEFSDAYLIADSLVAPTKMRRESETSLHFRQLAALLLTAVFLHIRYIAKKRGWQASMAGAWRFMTQSHKDLPSCLKTMRQTQHHSAGVHQAIANMTQAVQNITGDRELSSVWSTAIRPLVLYNDPRVEAATATSDVNLFDLQNGPDPISLYLIAPSTRSLRQLHPMYRVLLEVIHARLLEGQPGPGRRRLLNIYDELPAYGYMAAVEEGLPVEAGYGLKSLLVLQDLEQLWETYGTSTQIWGNVAIKIFQTIANDLTAKRISENLLGTATIENPVAQQSPVMGRRTSVSLQHTARELLKTDEVMALAPTQQIVSVVGYPPFLTERCNYRTDPNFQGRWEEGGEAEISA